MSDSKSKTPPGKGDMTPDFALFTHDEQTWRLSDQQSQPFVLLFFRCENLLQAGFWFCYCNLKQITSTEYNTKT